ncbi:hypothetical protein V9T40_007810 [Parthenolecanium corni]|uniref:Uncharacterized protein n=1 Tax=Parthenolecanium corni TaxID=536013 RepID=A0AAN9TKJ6_9HEMI
MRRSTVLKIYDRLHVNSVRVCWAVGLLAASVSFYRICEILFIPTKPYNIEDDEEFKKIMKQRKINPNPN